ncbi:MAG: QueT transporter family protein [Candidatus Bathyarchaeota archaeon]|jgi:uncharacterized membrane protein
MRSRELGLTVAFTGLYTIILVTLAPVSFGPIQLRVADCLIPLAALFGWPVIVGVTTGCFLGNAYYWLGPHDVILGPIANLIAAVIIFALRKQQFLACVAGSIPIGVIVGSYLWVFFPPPNIFNLNLPLWGAMVISITISSLVAIAGIGYVLLRALSNSEMVRFFRSYGLRIYTKTDDN